MLELSNLMAVFGTTTKKDSDISTNMSGIGSLIPEIDVDISED